MPCWLMCRIKSLTVLPSKRNVPSKTLESVVSAMRRRLHHQRPQVVFSAAPYSRNKEQSFCGPRGDKLSPMPPVSRSRPRRISPCDQSRPDGSCRRSARGGPLHTRPAPHRTRALRRPTGQRVASTLPSLSRQTSWLPLRPPSVIQICACRGPKAPLQARAPIDSGRGIGPGWKGRRVSRGAN